MASLSRSPLRDVGTKDLLELRSFGPQDSDSEDTPLFSISPDGRRAALLLRRADHGTNSFCQSLVVVDLSTGASKVIDRGGSMIREVQDFGAQFSGWPSGFPASIVPAWSPDGRTIAYLKSVDGPAQVWTVAASGGAAHVLTHETRDVTAVTWSSDPATVLFETDRELTRAIAAIDKEGLSGWHYDDRFFPGVRTKPFPSPSAIATRRFAFDLRHGTVRPTTPSETAVLTAAGRASIDRRDLPDGKVAVLAARPLYPNTFLPESDLELTVGGTVARCTDPACVTSRSHWLSPDGRSVLLLARSGWGDSDHAFFQWTPVTAKVDRLSTTSDALIGCRPFGPRMLCAREASTQPRQLALIDPATGRTQTIFNPNADYDRLRSGKVERIFVTSSVGIKTFADVMLPTDFAIGRHYPLVVVNYQSRGFLSGGTNNEFPIPAIASAGMIVLSFQRPRELSTQINPPPTTSAEMSKIDLTDWADRRNVNSALTAALDQVEARGIVDEQHVGITGLSDGASTAAFALLNTNLFSAAALAGSTEEPVAMTVYAGPQMASDLAAAGYPVFGQPNAKFWEDASLAKSAQRVRAPILIQAPDHELLFSLPTVTSLRDAGVPTDLYVFHDEYHSKWQPAHRFAVWERTLRWFEFWFDLHPAAWQQAAPVDEIPRWQDWRKHWHPPG